MHQPPEALRGKREVQLLPRLRIDLFGNDCDHNVFVAPADNHVQRAVLFNDVADVIGGHHRLSVDADDDIIFFKAAAATQRKAQRLRFCSSWSNSTPTEAQLGTEKPRAHRVGAGELRG